MTQSRGACGRARPGSGVRAPHRGGERSHARPATPGRTTPVLHSGRRCLIYGISPVAPHGEFKWAPARIPPASATCPQGGRPVVQGDGGGALTAEARRTREAGGRGGDAHEARTRGRGSRGRLHPGGRLRRRRLAVTGDLGAARLAGTRGNPADRRASRGDDPAGRAGPHRLLGRPIRSRCQPGHGLGVRCRDRDRRPRRQVPRSPDSADNRGRALHPRGRRDRRPEARRRQHARGPHRLVLLRRDRRRHQGHHRRRPDHDLALEHATRRSPRRIAARSTRATCARPTTTPSRARRRPSSSTTSSG